MGKPGIKALAPASVANLACGFDVLGLAIDKIADEIIARPSGNPGISISLITGDKKQLSRDPNKNTAGIAAMRLMQFLGDNSGIELEIHKKLAIGTGLGSSASSATAAVVAVNALLGNPLSHEALLPFAVIGESVADGAFHADNVAPALLGGIVLVRDTKTLDVQRVYVPDGLFVTVVFPDVQIHTRYARSVVKDLVSLKDAISQNANLAGLILGFMQSDFDLISRSLQDNIIEPQRADLIPHYYNVKEAALNAGCLGCNISGAGPSVFALSNNKLIAESAAEAMSSVWNRYKIHSQQFISPVNKQGTVVC